MYRYCLLIRLLLAMSHCINVTAITYTGKQLCVNNTNDDSPQCYCDELCTAYGDCCFDGQISRNSSSLIEGENNSIDTFCMKLYYRPEFNFATLFGAYVVRKCSNSSVDCEEDPYSLQSVFPVSDEAGIAYLNAKCAECNGVNDFKYWQLSYTRLGAIGITAEFGNYTTDVLVSKILISHAVERFLQYPGDRVPRFCIVTEPSVNNCPSYQSATTCRHGTKLYRNKECCIASGDCPSNECEGFKVYRRELLQYVDRNRTTLVNVGTGNLVAVLTMEESKDSSDVAVKAPDKKIFSPSFINTQYQLLTMIHTDGSTQSVEKLAAYLYAINLYWERTAYKLFANLGMTYLYTHYPMGCFREKNKCSGVVMAAAIVSKAFITIQDKAELSQLVRKLNIILENDSAEKIIGNSSILTTVAWKNLLGAGSQFDISREREGALVDAVQSFYRSIFSISPESMTCSELTFVFSREIKVSCTKPTENGGISNLSSFLYVNVIVGAVTLMIF